MKEKSLKYKPNYLFILFLIIFFASCNNLQEKSINQIIITGKTLPIPQAKLNLSQPDRSVKIETECLSFTNANDASTILIDKNGFIWAGGRSGVTRWDLQSKTFINYTTSNGLAENYVTAFAISKEGQIWAGTHRGHISFFDGQSWNTQNV
ncbi:MAG: two-component regulator propeller domain-containing protein, partial [Omnitrophica WOR_2 bacterium]